MSLHGFQHLATVAQAGAPGSQLLCVDMHAHAASWHVHSATPLLLCCRAAIAHQSACRDLDNTGTTYLAHKLSNHLINEITRKLPEIQSYVDKTCVRVSGNDHNDP